MTIQKKNTAQNLCSELAISIIQCANVTNFFITYFPGVLEKFRIDIFNFYLCSELIKIVHLTFFADDDSSLYTRLLGRPSSISIVNMFYLYTLYSKNKQQISQILFKNFVNFENFQKSNFWKFDHP